MKVFTDLTQWTLRFAIALTFIGVISWRSMSCIEANAIAEAEMMKQQCPQSLVDLQTRFDRQEADWSERLKDRQHKNCAECGAKIELLEDTNEKCTDDLEKQTEKMSTLQGEHNAELLRQSNGHRTEIENLKSDHSKEIEALMVTIRRACTTKALGQVDPLSESPKQ